MKPAQEMIRLFEDLPEAIRNTLVVAQRCAVAAPKRKPILSSLAGDREAEARMLAEEARAGLARRLDAASIPEHERGPCHERLAFAIDVITRTGFPGHFLTVADFLQLAESPGIRVGPGRGSGPGSPLAWALSSEQR